MIRHRTGSPAPDPLRDRVHAQIRRDFGMRVEPFTLHDPVPALLAGFWMVCREATLAGVVPRAHKEAVATAVSSANRCPYCVDAHVMMLHATGSHDAAAALATGGGVRDPTVRALVEWARTSGTAPTAPPCASAVARAELVGTAVAFHYVNRMVSVLLDETPLPVRGERWKRPLRRLVGWTLGATVRRAKEPGAALAFLPDAPLPSDLAWAAASPAVAGAFARFAAAVDGAGAVALDAGVRAQVTAVLARRPHGGEPGPGRAWLDEATAGFDGTRRAEARLALLVARVPWQVDDAVVAAYRAMRPDDAALVAALAWSAFAAARDIGVRLGATLD